MNLFLLHEFNRSAFGLLLILLTATVGFSQQTGSVSGNVTGPKGDTLIGVTIRVNSLTDSTIRRGVVTDIDGRFLVDNLPVGEYKLLASFIGYNTAEQTLRIDSGRVELPTIILLESARQLREVVVKGKIATAEQKGDTLQFNANAFKVNRDAQAEDLIKKMPGVDMSGGAIKVQGEDVREILVDGKPFFGDDPTIALRNLPAEVIDKIEVFDRLSDQSQFTGINDGNTLKTINIITRADRRNGQFGKVYAGVGTPVAGTDGTFAAGGSVNLFKGDRRISIIGQSNNINQQNFSSQDLLGVLGGGAGNAGGGQRPGGRGGAGGAGRGGRGGGGGAPGGGGGSTDNFLVGQQSGINTTNSLGINYTDSWGKKMTVRGSYFLNQSNNRNEQSLLREYYQNQGESAQTYREQSTNNSTNLNHRLNFRLDYTINRNNSLLITPRLSFQTNQSSSLTDSDTRLGNSLLNQSDNTFSSRNQGYSFSNSLLFRHRFEKRGRTLSLNIGTSLNDRDGMSSLASINDFIGID
ncbi:MAG TPA: carboxypeptidase-like regulatory domain-containing protein, partial [Fibrella sp.]